VLAKHCRLEALSVFHQFACQSEVLLFVEKKLVLHRIIAPPLIGELGLDL